MSNEPRDKAITELMGLCWHDFSNESIDHCPLCGKKYTKLDPRINFSTWDGFGTLFTWAREQDWFKSFCWKNCLFYTPHHLPTRLVNPDIFADALLDYLSSSDA